MSKTSTIEKPGLILPPDPVIDLLADCFSYLLHERHERLASMKDGPQSTENSQSPTNPRGNNSRPANEADISNPVPVITIHQGQATADATIAQAP